MIIETQIEIDGYEFPVEVEVTDYQPEEPMERYYPGCHESVEYMVTMFDQEIPYGHPIGKQIDPDWVLEQYTERQI